jgi:hypothetical protein
LCSFVSRISEQLQETIGQHFIPLVSSRLLSNTILQRSASEADNSILSLYQFSAVKGCSKKIRELVRSWNHFEYSIECPIWISQVIYMSKEWKETMNDPITTASHAAFIDGKWLYTSTFKHQRVAHILKQYALAASASEVSSQNNTGSIYELCNRLHR